MQVQFLCYAFGGPDQYLGKSIVEAHERLIVERGVNRAHFWAIVSHLRDSLEQLEVPKARESGGRGWGRVGGGGGGGWGTGALLPSPPSPPAAPFPAPLNPSPIPAPPDTDLPGPHR